MECKLCSGYYSAPDSGELIDTLWNVNMLQVDEQPEGTLELIDTLWNVNEIYNDKYTIKGAELIDTLWNVNVINVRYL